MGSTSERPPACMLKPVRFKTLNGKVIQTDFVGIPRPFESHIFISQTKACYLGRKPNSAKVQDDFKACLPEAWQSVSALHAILKYKDGKVTIEDRSSNGTWVGKPGKGAGESEEDFKRLSKNIVEVVNMDSYVMLAQWPSGRKAEDVLIYKLVAIPPDAKTVHEKPPDQPAHIPTPPMFGGSAPGTNAPGGFDRLAAGKAAGSAAKLEPCKNCKTQVEEALQAKEQLATEKRRHEATKKERENANKELAIAKKDVENWKKQTADAKRASQNEKKKAEQAVQAKKSEVDAELAAAKNRIKELTASRDKLQQGIAPLVSAVKHLRAQNSENRASVTEMDEQISADVKAMDEVMKTHTLSQGTADMVKEHEEEISALQKDQRRVEREAAAWRLKAEAYATKLPDELNSVLNSHLPNLVQECIQKVHSRVIALNSATASQLFGPEASAGLAITQGAGGLDEERALGADYSQRTVVSSHQGGGTPELPTPMACEGDAAPRTAGPDTQPCSSQGGGGASISLRGLASGSQAPSPGGHVVVGPASADKAGRASEPADGVPNGGLKRPEVAAEAGQQGDGKRRRVGSARGGAGAKEDFPENHSQVNVNANASGNGKSTTGNGKSVGENGGEKARSQAEQAAASTQGKHKSDAAWTGGDSSAKSDLVKRLAALPKSHDL